MGLILVPSFIQFCDFSFTQGSAGAFSSTPTRGRGPLAWSLGGWLCSGPTKAEQDRSQRQTLTLLGALGTRTDRPSQPHTNCPPPFSLHLGKVSENKYHLFSEAWLWAQITNYVLCNARCSLLSPAPREVSARMGAGLLLQPGKGIEKTNEKGASALG